MGAFCIGTNQIDLDAAAQRGIAAFNAPYSNTRSVVELVIGEIIALARRLTEKTSRMHAGIWDKSAQGSHEVRGRTLGIVGYGNIGTQLSNLAESLGFRVIFFDTADRLAHGNARRVGTLDQLLAEADVVSLHVDGRPGNAGLFGAAQFAKMKPRSLFINASRGMVVDDVALREHILSGHIAGAALDVFPVEPKAQGDPFESALRGLPNVILTPHVGGSTQEAQEEIGFFVSGKLSDYVHGGSTALSVNLPEVPVPRLESGERLALLHHNVPGVLASVNQLLADHQVNVGRSTSPLGGAGLRGHRHLRGTPDGCPGRPARGRPHDLAAHPLRWGSPCLSAAPPSGRDAGSGTSGREGPPAPRPPAVDPPGVAGAGSCDQRASRPAGSARCPVRR